MAALFLLATVVAICSARSAQHKKKTVSRLLQTNSNSDDM